LRRFESKVPKTRALAGQWTRPPTGWVVPTAHPPEGVLAVRPTVSVGTHLRSKLDDAPALQSVTREQVVRHEEPSHW